MGSSSLTRDRAQAPLHWEHGVLAIGPPGKSPWITVFKRIIIFHYDFLPFNPILSLISNCSREAGPTEGQSSECLGSISWEDGPCPAPSPPSCQVHIRRDRELRHWTHWLPEKWFKLLYSPVLVWMYHCTFLALWKEWLLTFQLFRNSIQWQVAIVMQILSFRAILNGSVFLLCWSRTTASCHVHKDDLTWASVVWDPACLCFTLFCLQGRSLSL